MSNSEHSQAQDCQSLLHANHAWAESFGSSQPGFFEKGAKGQAPQYLWFGCSDSRVPESVVLDQKPGEVFVHRNIANQFQADDDSANAVLEYGVLTVGVKHVIVVGHSKCGGCIAAWGSPKPADTVPAGATSTHLTRFLAPLIQLRHSLPQTADENTLVEENVKLGVKNVLNSHTMRLAKEQNKEVHVHGWVYDLASGKLRDLAITQKV